MNCFNLTRNGAVFILFFLFLSAKAQTKEATWKYPVRPGTEEWKQLGTFSERLNAFNIPEGILAEMTTENLVKTCLNYPWWILITSRDHNQAGYDYLKSVFNGFRELGNRVDAGRELLKVYEKMAPGDITNYETLEEQGTFSFRFTHIEILLSQPDILKNISDEYLMSLIRKAVSVYEDKTVAFDKYSYYGISSSCLILARIMELKNYPEFTRLSENYPGFKNLNERGVSGNKELLDQIVSESKQILKD